ncbi:hypothetical protein EMIT0196MI5_20066 [Pseudomonas sp. IT-196MI5]
MLRRKQIHCRSWLASEIESMRDVIGCGFSPYVNFFYGDESFVRIVRLTSVVSSIVTFPRLGYAACFQGIF